jgi:hypothetical protein
MTDKSSIDRLGHTLNNIVLDENGLTDKYKEFSDSDFSNDFIPLDEEDYKIRASQKGRNVIIKEENMKGTRKEASYIDELSSGYDAKVQDDYEAGQGQKGQEGKGHEEEVAPSNNWENDKRDAIGRAASAAKLMRRTAARLIRQADLLEGKKTAAEDYDELDTPDEDEEFSDIGGDEDEGMDVEAAVEGTEKQAAHPIEHNEKKDDPDANMPSDTGDEWIDIGPGEFDEKRDEVGRAGENEKK